MHLTHPAQSLKCLSLLHLELKWAHCCAKLRHRFMKLGSACMGETAQDGLVLSFGGLHLVDLELQSGKGN